MNKFIILAIFIVICCMAICLGIRSYYQKKMELMYQELLQNLDKILSNGSYDIHYDESMDGAIKERLKRIMQIVGMNRRKAETERDLVKSLISDISHQVRTPLTNILLYTGLLQEKEISKDAQILAGKIQKQSQKLDFYMKELMKTSYAESEMITLHPEQIAVSEMVYAACQFQELAAMKKKIVLKVDVTDDSCYADKKWTIEAINNVLENAIKYSPEQSSIEIKVIPYEAFICVTVKDSGIGIREEEQGKVYERFYRSKEVSHEPGFGIGLYLVREVLSKQNGYTKISSVPGKGTTMALFLSRYHI